MLYLSRRQIFNDGNKRVAMLAANHVMIKNGAGVISVPPSKLGEFIKYLTDFYKSNDMTEAKQFIYDNCITGNGVEK